MLEQTLDGELEYLVMDGASSDETLDALAPFRDRITHLSSEPDRGLYDAMNKGLALASGEIVGFLHADDRYPHPNVLAKVVQVFSDNHLQACHGDLVMVRPGPDRGRHRAWRSSPFRPGAFGRGWMPPHPAFFARRSVYQRLGDFDLRFTIAADFELMLRLLERHRIASAYLPEVLVEMTAGGASNGSLRRILRANRECLRAFQVNGLRAPFWFVPMKLGTHALQLLHRTRSRDAG